MQPNIFILDVDGVMNTGQFWYSAEGKVLKCFGAHDNDGLKMLKPFMEIRFMTADKRGFPITKKRIVEDMGLECDIVSEKERHAYLEKIGYDRMILMADGYHDAPCLKLAAFGIAPASARKEAKEAADFVTESKAGEGAVLDACLEIKRRFFPDA